MKKEPFKTRNCFSSYIFSKRRTILRNYNLKFLAASYYVIKIVCFGKCELFTIEKLRKVRKNCCSTLGMEINLVWHWRNWNAIFKFTVLKIKSILRKISTINECSNWKLATLTVIKGKIISNFVPDGSWNRAQLSLQSSYYLNTKLETLASYLWSNWQL